MNVLVDAAGRRRSPVTLPGYHAGGSCCGALRNEASLIAATLLETLHGAG